MVVLIFWLEWSAVKNQFIYSLLICCIIIIHIEHVITSAAYMAYMYSSELSRVQKKSVHK